MSNTVGLTNVKSTFMDINMFVLFVTHCHASWSFLQFYLCANTGILSSLHSLWISINPTGQLYVYPLNSLYAVNSQNSAKWLEMFSLVSPEILIPNLTLVAGGVFFSSLPFQSIRWEQNTKHKKINFCVIGLLYTGVSWSLSKDQLLCHKLEYTVLSRESWFMKPRNFQLLHSNIMESGWSFPSVVCSTSTPLFSQSHLLCWTKT